MWEVWVSKFTGRKHPVQRILDLAADNASEPRDKKMIMTPKTLMKAVCDDADPDGSQVRHTTIMGVKPTEGEDPDAASVSLLILNGRKELSVLVFNNSRDLDELCAALQVASDTIFGDDQPDDSAVKH